MGLKEADFSTENKNYKVKFSVTDGWLKITDEDVPDEKVVTKTHGSEAEEEEKAYHIGETVTWTVTVTNIYNEEKKLTVTEKEGMTITGNVPETLKAGETIELTVEYVVTAADVEAGSIKNEVKVKLGDLEKPGNDTVETEPIEITITADSDSKVYDGTPLTLDSWKLTSGELAQGNTINSVKVTGTQTLVGSSDNVPSGAKIVDAKGEDATKGYKITYVNGTLTVTDGTGPDEEEVKDDLVVTKTVDGKEYKSGETITFTITATNIYADARTITLEEIDGVTLEKSTFEDVPGGETVETTATHTVTPQDIKEGEGSFKNTVTAKVGALEKKAEAEAMIEPAKPHVKLVKTVTSKPEDGKAYLEGETVTYQITVKNDGNVPVEGISVSDELTGDSWQIRILEPGEEQLFDTEYEVTAEDAEARKVTNVVTGKTPDDDVPVDPGTTDVPTAKKYPLTIHYVYTATGAQAAPDYTAELKEGEAYSVTSPAISGYTASRTTVSGSMPKRPHEETVFYTATEPAPVPPTPVTPGTPGGPAVPALTVIEDPETPLGLGNLSLNAGECIE